MKILHVVPSLNPQLGGPTNAALNLASEQISIGNSVEIVTTNDCGLGVQPFSTQELVDYQNIPVRFFERSILRRKEFIPSWGLLSWLSSNVDSYDILHLHYLFTFTSTAAFLNARKKGVPYVVRPLGQLSEWALRQGAVQKNIYSALFERSMLKHAAFVHATSAGEAEDISRFVPSSRIEVVPLGIDVPQEVPFSRELACARWEVPRDGLLLLFLSRLHPKKRLDLVLRALAELKKELQGEVHLIIAGSGEAEYEQELRRLAAELDVSKLITWVGFVSGEDKEIVLRAADIFVLPSFSENFGIAVGEAMACGVPVVVTEGVQIADEIGLARAGLVVDGNGENLVSALRQLSENELMRSEMGKNGAELVKSKYSWSSSASSLQKLYKESIRKKLE